MQNAIAAFQTAPWWAQIAIVLFAIMVVVAVVERSVQRPESNRFPTGVDVLVLKPGDTAS